MAVGFSRDRWYNYIADRSHPPVASAVVEKPEYDPDHVYAWKPANNYKGWKLIARGEAGVDDAEVIRSVISEGLIFIKRATYSINSIISANNLTNLAILAEKGTVFKATGDIGAILRFGTEGSCENIEIAGIEIDGGGYDVKGIDIWNSNKIKITNVYVHDTGKWGIGLGNCSKIQLKRIEINGCGTLGGSTDQDGAGLFVSGVNDVIVKHTRLLNNKSYGVWFKQSATATDGRLYLEDVIAENNGYIGIGAQYYLNAVYVACKAINNGDNGIDFYVAENVKLIGCYSESNSKNGFFLGHGAKNAEFVECEAYKNGLDGFAIDDESSNVRVIGCIANENNEAGLRVWKSNDVEIVGGDYSNNGKGDSPARPCGINIDSDDTRTNFIIMGVKITGNENGIRLGLNSSATIDHYIITGCILTGNTNAINEINVGTNKVVTNNLT